jgi:hypothetical protein
LKIGWRQWREWMKFNRRRQKVKISTAVVLSRSENYLTSLVCCSSCQFWAHISKSGAVATMRRCWLQWQNFRREQRISIYKNRLATNHAEQVSPMYAKAP